MPEETSSVAHVGATVANVDGSHCRTINVFDVSLIVSIQGRRGRKRRCDHTLTEERSAKVTITAEPPGDNVCSGFDSVAVSPCLASFDPLTPYHQLRHCGTTTLGTLKVVLYAVAPSPFALSANHPPANETIHAQPDREVPKVIDTGAS
jgi:hypothetical protein